MSAASSAVSDPHPVGCPLCVIQDGHGLQKHFIRKGDATELRLRLPRRLQGYPGIAHGGYLAMLFDEVVGHAVGCRTEGVALTRELRIQYDRPVPVESQIVVIGVYERADENRHLHHGSGRLYDASGTLLAKAYGLFLIGEGRTIRRLLAVRGRSA